MIETTSENPKRETPPSVPVTVYIDKTGGYTKIYVYVKGTKIYPKKSHNKCFGRGYEGLNEKKEPVICSCISNKVRSAMNGDPYNYITITIDNDKDTNGEKKTEV